MKNLTEIIKKGIITLASIGFLSSASCKTISEKNLDNYNYEKRISGVNEDFGCEESGNIPVKYNNSPSKIKLKDYTQSIVEIR